MFSIKVVFTNKSSYRLYQWVNTGKTSKKPISEIEKLFTSENRFHENRS